MRMPSYEIFGAGASYRFPIGSDYIYMRLNINNLFDEEYYQESANNYGPDYRDGIMYKGINVENTKRGKIKDFLDSYENKKFKGEFVIVVKGLK